MHNSLQVSSRHVTPRPYVLDQGSTPNFHMDLILTWRQNVSRCRNLHSNTRHCSFFKLKICFAHCVFKLRNARHKHLFFFFFFFSLFFFFFLSLFFFFFFFFFLLVNRCTCLNFALCVSPRDSAFDIQKKKSGAYTI